MQEVFQSLSTRALEQRELTLTCKGMSFVNWNSSSDDFEFVIANGRTCRVHSILAEFLSPKIARLRQCDPFFSVYEFKDDFTALFDALECLVSAVNSGNAFRVEQSNFAAFLRLSQELENSELLCSLLGMIKTECLRLDEAIVLLRAGLDSGTAFADQFRNLRDFVASHFHQIEKEILDDMDLETAQLVLSSPSLQIEDEDSLYDFVRSRSENDTEFMCLFEFIYFEYLSVSRIEDFASFASECLLEDISSGIWKRICGRLILETKLEKNPRTVKKNEEPEKEVQMRTGSSHEESEEQFMLLGDFDDLFG